MIRNLFFILIFVLAGNCIGQTKKAIPFVTFLKDYDRLINLQPTKNYHVKITTEYFTSVDNNDPAQSQSTELMVLEENGYVYDMGSTLQIQEDDLRIDIDTVRKRILISKAKMLDLNFGSDQMLEKMDSANYSVSKIITKEKITYELSENKQLSNYKTISFQFDAKNNNFLGLELNLWPQNYTSEQLEDESTESPKLIYTYSPFTQINETALKPNHHLSYWCVQESGKIKSKNTNYQLHDLR